MSSGGRAPGQAASRPGGDAAQTRTGSAIEYPDFLAGVRHQEFYSLLVHGVAILLQGMPEELAGSCSNGVSAAAAALRKLGLDDALLAPFDDAAADVLTRSRFRQEVEAGTPPDDIAALASLHVHELDRAMGRVRETLPRDSSLRYTAGIHIGSACFQSTMILSLARLFPAEAVAALRPNHAQILLAGARHARANLRLYLGTGAPPMADLPSYLQCLLMMVERIEADTAISADTASALLILARDLYGYLGYRSLAIETVCALRLCTDATLVAFLDTAQRHADDPDSAAQRLLSAYAASGDAALLDEAVQAAQAEADRERRDPAAHAIRLNVLGGALWERYLNRGAVSDLDQSIAIVEEVLPRFRDTPIESSLRNNLGMALEHRFGLTMERSALDEAIEQLTGAVYPAFPLPEIHPMWRHNLGNALRTRYTHFDEPSDLYSATENLGRALEATAADSPDLALHRQSLANALADRFRLHGNPEDIDRAIELYRAAVSGLDERSPDFPKFSGNLARALEERSRTGRVPADGREASEAFSRAVRAGIETSAGHTLQHARAWGEWAFSRRAWEEAATAFDHAMRAGDELQHMQLSRVDKESWLRSTQGLAANAAYARLQLGEAGEAVAVLERGIGRLISERLDLDRIDPDRLRELGRDDLADRYLRVAGQLQLLEGTTEVAGQAGRRPGMLQDRRDARRELRSILDAIDAVTGKPGRGRPAEDEASARRKRSRLVYVAATVHGGMALLHDGRTGYTDGVPLPGLALGAVIERVARLRAGRPATDAWIAGLDAVCRWLWDSVMAPVLDALGDERQAVLIPCGPVALLPLHAAWTPDPGRTGGRRYACDDVLFTYAPNARSLAGERDGGEVRALRRALVVHSPANTGLPEIPLCEVEAQSVSAAFDAPKVLHGEHASRLQVLEALPGCDVAHFGCHGAADLLDPLQSSLCLADGEVLSVADLLDARLQNLRLVVLSACDTNVAGQKLPDEVVSLATGLLHAGAASVLSTLWPVADVSTAMLMDRFYHLWRREGRNAQEALALAQRWLRDTTHAGFLRHYKQVLRTPERFITPPRSARRLIDELESMAEPGDDSRPFASPFFWAAFQWNGQRLGEPDTTDRSVASTS